MKRPVPAMAAKLSRGWQGNPILILLDLIMPEMDGWEFLRGRKVPPRPVSRYFVLSASDPTGLIRSYADFRQPRDLILWLQGDVVAEE
jgi:CheY-like chemotaxis protein